MSELRREPVLQRWVVVTGQSWETLLELLKKTKGGDQEPCPFCPGHEAETPFELFALREPGTSVNQAGWMVRVVPNKFPFLRIEGELERTAEGIYDRISGVGAHEIVIETPAHRADWGMLEPYQLEGVFRAYRERSLDLRRDERFRSIVVARNHGPYLATLTHPHSHLLALTVIPKRIEEELRGLILYYERKERCAYCDTIRQELGSNERVIQATPRFLAYVPFAARYPLETWIIPTTHAHDFGLISDPDLKELAGLVRDVMARIRKLVPEPTSSLVLHTSPLQGYTEPRYHWHIEIRVRLPVAEGFEWGTGFFVNPLSPEEAARLLKEAAP